MYRKLTAMLLVLVMVFSILPVATFADDGEEISEEPETLEAIVEDEGSQEAEIPAGEEEEEPPLEQVSEPVEEITEPSEENPVEEEQPEEQQVALSEEKQVEEEPEPEASLVDVESDSDLRDALENDQFVRITDNVTLTGDIEISQDQTLQIEHGYTLTVPAGVSINNNGQIRVFGSLINNGTYEQAISWAKVYEMSDKYGTGTVSGISSAVSAYQSYWGPEDTDFSYNAFSAALNLSENYGEVFVDIDGQNLTIAENVSIPNNVRVSFNDANSTLTVSDSSVVKVFGSLYINQNITANINGFILVMPGADGNFGSIYDNCGRIINLNWEGRAVNEQALELVLSNMDTNRWNEIKVISSFTVTNDLYISDQTGLVITSGNTLTMYNGTRLDVDGEVKVYGTLDVSNATINKGQNGRLLKLLDGEIIGGTADGRVYEVDITSETGLINAINTFKSGGYSEAWLHIHGGDTVTVTGDLQIPDGVSINLDEDWIDDQQVCGTLVVSSGVRLEFCGFLNAQGNPDISCITVNGTLVFLGNMNCDERRITVTQDGRCYIFRNGVTVNDSRDLNECAYYSDKTDRVYAVLGTDYTSEENITIPRNMCLVIPDGYTLTMGSDTKLDIADELRVIGTLDISKNGVSVSKHDGGHILVLQSGQIIGNAGEADGRVLETYFEDEAQLRDAIDTFINDGYDEAWLHVRPDDEITISHDLEIPGGVAIIIEEYWDESFHHGQLNVAPGARLEFCGFLNGPGDPNYSYVNVEGTFVLLGDTNIGDQCISVPDESSGRCYNFRNGNFILNDERDLDELIRYSDRIDGSLWIMLGGNFTIGKNMVLPRDFTIAVDADKTLTIAENVYFENYGRISLSGTLNILGEFSNLDGGSILLVNDNAEILGNDPWANVKKVLLVEVSEEKDTEEHITGLQDIRNAFAQAADYEEVWVDVYKNITLTDQLEIPQNAHIAFFPGGCLNLSSSALLIARGGIQFLNDRTCVNLSAGSVVAFSGWFESVMGDWHNSVSGDGIVINYLDGSVYTEDSYYLAKVLQYAPAGRTNIVVFGNDPEHPENHKATISNDVTVPESCILVINGTLTLGENVSLTNLGEIQVYGILDTTDGILDSSMGKILKCQGPNGGFGTVLPDGDAAGKSVTKRVESADDIYDSIDMINSGDYDIVYCNIDGAEIFIDRDTVLPDGLFLFVNDEWYENGQHSSSRLVLRNRANLRVEGVLIINDDSKLVINSGSNVAVAGYTNVFWNSNFCDYHLENNGSIELLLDTAAVTEPGTQDTWSFAGGWEVTFKAPADGWYEFTGSNTNFRAMDIRIAGDKYWDEGIATRTLWMSANQTAKILIETYGGDPEAESTLTAKHLDSTLFPEEYWIESGAAESAEGSNFVNIPLSFKAPATAESMGGYVIVTVLTTNPQLFAEEDGKNWIEKDFDAYDYPYEFILKKIFDEPAPDGHITASAEGLLPGTYYYASAICELTADMEDLGQYDYEKAPQSFTVDDNYAVISCGGSINLSEGEQITAKFTAEPGTQYIARLSGNGSISIRDENNKSIGSEQYDNIDKPGSADIVFNVPDDDNEHIYCISAIAYTRAKLSVEKAQDDPSIESLRANQTNSLKTNKLYRFESEGDSVTTFDFSGYQVSYFAIMRGDEWFYYNFEDSATLAFEGPETVYIKADVYWAAEDNRSPVKLNITEYAFAMNEGLRVNIFCPTEFPGSEEYNKEDVKNISHEGYFCSNWDSPDSYAIYTNQIPKGEDAKTYWVYPVIMDSTYHVLNLDEEGCSAALIDVKFKWSVAGASVATVKQPDKNSPAAQITLKPGTSGTCLVSATTADKLKVAGSLPVHVMDYTPRIDSAKLTMNTYLKDTTIEVGFHPSYPELGYGIADVAVDSTLFEASYSDDTLYIRSVGDAEIQKFSGKLRINVQHENGSDSYVDISLAVKNVKPTFKATSSVPVNYAQGTEGYVLIQSSDSIERVKRINASDFRFDEYDGVGLAVYYDGIWDGTSKVNAKADLTAEFSDYKDEYKNVVKTVSIKCNKNAPKVTVASKVMNFNTAFDCSGRGIFRPSIPVVLTDAAVGLMSVELEPTGKLITDAFQVFYDENEECIIAEYDSSKVAAAGKYAYNFQPVLSNGTPVGKPVKITLNVTNAAVTASVKASGKLDLLCPETTFVQYTLTLKNTSQPGGLILSGADAREFELDPSNRLHIKYGHEYSTKKAYSIQLIPVLEDGTRLKPINQTVKITQGKLKLLVTPKQNVFYQSQSRDRTLEYTISLVSPEGASIDYYAVNIGKVKFWKRGLVDNTKSIDFYPNDDNTELTVLITLKDTAKLKPGNYTLPLEIYPEFASEGTKPVKANIVMKVVK